MLTNLNALYTARRERLVAVRHTMSNVQRCARTLKGAATVVGAVALAILFYACASSASAAQEADSPHAMMNSPRPDAPDGPGDHGPRHGRGGPRGGFRGSMGGDAAARLLDNQTALQLSGSQVTRLIALHKSAVSAAKPLQQQLMTMFQSTHRDSASSGSQRGARPRPTPAQRDSAMAIMEQLREQRWRNTSAADSVLTADQRKVAAQLFGRHH